VRYKGTKTVAITPDYSEVAKLTDLWLNPKQGTDAALAQAVFHVDLPRTGTGAVHPVGGAHDLVVLPARMVDVLPIAGLFAGLAVALGELVLLAVEEPQLIQ
jgi:hypothetical protein